jgi:hypothetical protein
MPDVLQECVICIFHWFVDVEDECDMFLHNVGNQLLSDVTLHPIRLEP